MNNRKLNILFIGFAVLILAYSCSKTEVKEEDPIPEEIVLLKPGKYIDTLVVNNVKRPFYYNIPEGLPDSCAIVFDFHGSIIHHSEANPNKINDVLSSGSLTDFSKKASQINKYVYVYPKGEEIPAENVIHWANEVNIAFFEQMRTYFLKRYPKISKRKVYCCGHSSGAIFSLRLAFTRPQLVSAVVSISGQYSFKTTQPTASPNPVPIMQVNGKIDPTVNYDAALTNARTAVTIIHSGGEELVEKGITLNNATDPSKPYIADKYTWKGVKADYVFYGINGVEHGVSWSIMQPYMWKFMEEHPTKIGK